MKPIKFVLLAIGALCAIAVFLPFLDAGPIKLSFWELREAKAALLAWQDQRGSACATVMFTVSASPELHEDIPPILERLYRDEVELSPLLQRLEVSVAILDGKGKPACEYRLGHQQPQVRTAAAKPWWKFW